MIGRRRSVFGPLVLIGIGALFLYANIRPEFDPWPFLSRYWPLLLILAGIAKMLDYFWERSKSADGGGRGWISGAEMVIILAVVVLGTTLMLSRRAVSGIAHPQHEDLTLDRQGAKLVRAHIQIPTGEVHIEGGASKLLEATLEYDEREGKPFVSYFVQPKPDAVGDLTINQPERRHVRLGFQRRENNWQLRFQNDVPLELKIDMGAGKSDLRLSGLSLRKLDVEGGVGNVDADLTGDWKNDLDATIKGGVGNVKIRLPKDVGVRVHASGGIGNVSARGLQRQGDDYVNALFDQSPVSLHIEVSGGVGNIELISE